MNLDTINKWLTLIANFGVVAGIFFLAIEIRQNQESLELSQEQLARQYELETIAGHQAIADSSDEMRLLFADNADAARVWIEGNSGKELSEVDLVRYQGLCSLSIWNDAVAHRRTIALSRTEETSFLESAIRTKIDAWPGFKLCWDQRRDGLREWGYGSLVEGVENASGFRRSGFNP